MRTIHRVFVSTLALAAGVALALPPANFPLPKRDGFRLVDGAWVRPELTLRFDDLVRIDDSEEQLRVISKPSRRVEQLLFGQRIAVVEIAGSPLAWKLSMFGRQWRDEQRDAPTQHLLAVAAMDGATTGIKPLITKIEIKPDAVVVQGVWREPNGVAVQAIVLLGADYTELAAMPAGELTPTFIARAGTARDMLNRHPLEARQYMLPLLRPLTQGRNPLHPRAGDVYRAFPGLPADPQVTARLESLVPALADADPATRREARADLAALGRPGVLAALQFDRTGLPPEADLALNDLIASNTRDSRTAETLRADRFFLSDCLTDPDPRVGQAVIRHLTGGLPAR